MSVGRDRAIKMILISYILLMFWLVSRGQVNEDSGYTFTQLE